VVACSPVARAPAPFPMRRGVNLGDALEAGAAVDRGNPIAGGDLAAIAKAGFDGLRLPVRWDEHADTEAPYSIAADFVRNPHD